MADSSSAVLHPAQESMERSGPEGLWQGRSEKLQEGRRGSAFQSCLPGQFASWILGGSREGVQFSQLEVGQRGC